MARFEVEFLRTNVTVGQFLSYVRAQLKKRGLDDFIGSLDYDNFIGGNGIDCKVDHKKLNDEAYAQLGVEYEEVRDLPYNKKSYQRNINGVASNEIIEFEFDSEKSGRGYYYLVDGEDEVESVESTTDEAAAAESETEAENEPVDNGENNSCGERAAANQTNEGADNLNNRERGNNMMKETMEYRAMVQSAARLMNIPDSYDAYESDGELNAIAENYVVETLHYSTVSEPRKYGHNVYFISPDKMVVARKTIREEK